MGDVRWPPSRSKQTLSGHVTAILAIAFLSCLVNGQSGVRPLQPSGRHIANYRIVPKPCKVKQSEGTCMFVWECMKTDGKAIGMCVDGFMFGSCCVHDADNNLIDFSRSKNETTEIIPTTGNDVISKVQSVATPIVTTSFPSDSAGVSAKPNDKVALVAETTAPTMSQTASTTKSPTTATTSHDSEPATKSASAVPSIVTTNNLKPIFSTNTPTTVTLNPTTTPQQGSKTTTVNKTSPMSVPTMTVPDTMTALMAAQVADGKPVVVGSSVTVTGSTASFVPKNSSSNSSSTTVIQGSNFQSSVAPSRPVVSSEATGANVVVSSNIAIKPTAETISVPAFLPEGLIIQTATKPTRPTPSSARPTSSTSSPTAKPQAISASASGDTTTSTTNSDNVISLGLNRPFSGVSVETTIGSHEFHSHSVDAQFFVVSSTTAIKSSTTERPSTTQKTAETTTRDTPSLTDTVTAVPVDQIMEPVEFPEYLLEVTNAPNTANKRCGMQNPMPKVPTSRVVGGSSTVYGAWPWQASIRRTSFFGFSSTHRCGGTLLNENFVITAAHCVEDLLLTQIRVRLGEYDVSSLTEPFPVVERAVTKKIVHPKYNFFTYEHDIAILKLEEPVELSPTISPICLPSSDDLLVGMNATVTGWGRLSEGGTLPNVLQQVTLPIISNDKCKSMFLKSGRHEFIPEIFLCAGYEEGGRDACQGDSGGPLQIKTRDGRYFLAGIISWGIGCAEPNLPGVCTRISKFTNWILENVSS